MDFKTIHIKLDLQGDCSASIVLINRIGSKYSGIFRDYTKND